MEGFCSLSVFASTGRWYPDLRRQQRAMNGGEGGLGKRGKGKEGKSGRGKDGISSRRKKERVK